MAERRMFAKTIIDSDAFVHNGNHALDTQLRILGQIKFEETHTREEFIRLFIRSNL